MKPIPVIALMSACCVASSAQAMDPAQERAERDRIKHEREQAEVAYRSQERECRQKFVVTPCIDQARRDRRETLDRLRQQQAVLDEVERKQRAAQRMDDIRSKVSGDEAKQREAAAQKRRRQPAEPAAAASQPDASASSPAAALKQEPPSAVTKPASANASAMEVHEQKAQAYEKRQKDAAEHRAEVERRNAQRAAGGKQPAKPLPTPASAASKA